MALRTAGSVLVVFLWSVAVVLGQIGWSVTYTTQSICVLKGSTVELTCSYTYPSGTVSTTFWFTKNDAEGNPVSLSEDPDYKGRVTYHRDKKNGHTLTITDLRESDSATYKFRFITDQTGGKYTGVPGVTLSLTDKPKSTSVSVSPSGEIVEDSSVTLTCSSDANPPVIKYTWYFQNQTFLNGFGQMYNISNFKSKDNGHYHCEAWNGRGSRNSTALMIILPGKQTSVLTAAVGIIVVVLVLILCLFGLMWFRRSTGGSDATADTQSVRPDCNSDTYTALNMRTMSPDCDTLASVRPDPNSDPNSDTYTPLNMKTRSPEM